MARPVIHHDFRRGRRRPPRLPPSPWRSGWGRFTTLWLGALFIGTAYGSRLFMAPDHPPPMPALAGGRAMPAPGATAPAGNYPTQRRFGLCHSGGGTNCVVDGDTLWVDGQNVRIADIDTPETHEPRCAAEQALGDRATARLHELVNAGPVTLAPIDRDADSYGRKLRIVEVAGSSVGHILVGEGLARWYGRGRRSWCD